jgi:hypothetical protein
MFGNSTITLFELADGRGFVHNFCPEAPGTKSIEIIFSPKPAAELACGVCKVSTEISPALEAKLVREFGGLHDNHRTTFGGSIMTMAKEESAAHIAALTAEFDKQKTLIETLTHELQSARIEADEACKEKDELSHRLEALEQEKCNALRVAHDATKTILTMERQLEASSTGYDTLHEEMVLQERELSKKQRRYRRAAASSHEPS